jgi:hypothetical protein
MGSALSRIFLPHASFFDRVEPLDSNLEKVRVLLSDSPALATSLPAMLMWQDEFSYSLALKEKTSFIVALYGQNVYLPAPPCPYAPGTLKDAFDYMSRVNGPGVGISRIEGLTEDALKVSREAGYPTRPTLMEYLYDRNQVEGLHGDAFRSKRAEINHLQKEHSVTFRPYRSSDLPACTGLFELWKSQRLSALKDQMGEKMLLSSRKAHFRALTQGADWGMQGWVVLLEDRLAAYSMGAVLNPSTYGIFLEITDLTVKGLSAYIFANVCRQAGAFTFINTGDAEGLPRLAESKEHWHPIRRLQVYAVDPRSEKSGG